MASRTCTPRSDPSRESSSEVSYNTASQLAASSATLCATVPPYRVNSSALPRCRSYALRLKPRQATFARSAGPCSRRRHSIQVHDVIQRFHGDQIGGFQISMPVEECAYVHRHPGVADTAPCSCDIPCTAPRPADRMGLGTANKARWGRVAIRFRDARAKLQTEYWSCRRPVGRTDFLRRPVSDERRRRVAKLHVGTGASVKDRTAAH